MPVHVARRGNLYRVVEGDGSIATTSKGNARDGGGHRSQERAAAQARAINEGIAEKEAAKE